jgi:hypothetical protein
MSQQRLRAAARDDVDRGQFNGGMNEDNGRNGSGTRTDRAR